MINFLNTPGLTRGIRNNNPGNLILTNINWLGKIPNQSNTDGRFEQFNNILYGIRAMSTDLVNDWYKGKKTVVKIISEYAPANENDTAQYITNVSRKLNISPNSEINLTEENLIKLVRAIIDQENGKDSKLVSDKNIIDGVQMMNLSIKNKLSKKKAIVSGAVGFSLLMLMLYIFYND